MANIIQLLKSTRGSNYGMLEKWNLARVGKWNSGIMECWKNGGMKSGEFWNNGKIE